VFVAGCGTQKPGTGRARARRTMNALNRDAAAHDASSDGDLWLDENGFVIVSPQGLVSPFLTTFEELLPPSGSSGLAAAWARARQGSEPAASRIAR
jgi:hypothetical protein